MDALELLHQRVSCPALNEPAPTSEQLDVMFQAALRAPDHGAIRPWRFLLVEGEGRQKLGQLFLQAAKADDPELSSEKQQKILNMPLRAPSMIVVIASTKEHAKVPDVEQQISAGCAAQNIILAAHAQGVGAMWRTGDMAYHPGVKSGLGLTELESIIGYIYLGTPRKLRRAPEHDISSFVSSWGA
jgi:nitroreductase